MIALYIQKNVIKITRLYTSFNIEISNLHFFIFRHEFSFIFFGIANHV